MATSNEELLFNQALCGRVQQFRAETGMTAEGMAIALGVPPDRYRKYETRSPMPSYLMARFCAITHTTLDELLLGIGRKRSVPARQATARRA